MGDLKLKLSTEAVIQAELQCLAAAKYAAISIQYINLPPIKSPKVLVSLGKTNSFMVVNESFAFLASMFCCLEAKDTIC